MLIKNFFFSNLVSYLSKNLTKTSSIDFKKLFEQDILPILTLLILPPLLAEVLYGSTYLSVLFLIIPEIGIYGCYNVIVRYLINRYELNNIAILLFGIVFALFEQGLIRQTALAPLAVIAPEGSYGRFYDVNWIYLIWSLGYQGIWGVFIPQKMYELLFPKQKNKIKIFGIILALFAFLISCIAEWYSWTQIAYPQYNNTQAYQPSQNILLGFLITITLLIILAFIFKTNKKKKIKNEEKIPYIILICLTTFILALSWFWLLLFAFGAFPSIPLFQPIIFSIIIAFVAYTGLSYWSKSSYWTDATSIAVISSVLGASMLAGFVTTGITNDIDIFAKIIFDIFAMVILISWYKKMVNEQKL